MSLVDRYLTWFEYETDAHTRTLEALDTVPAERRDEDFQKALDLFSHLMACRRLWLHRIGAVDSGPETVEAIFPVGNARQDLDGQLAEMIGDWLPYLTALDHAEVGRRFEYASLEGERFVNSVEDVLTQLFGHAWHHRGQIMSLVRRCGGEPAATDYVLWCRRRVARS